MIGNGLPSRGKAAPQLGKALCCRHWERLGGHAGNGSVTAVVAFHSIDGVFNHVQKLQAKLHSTGSRPAALSRRQSSYVINRPPGTLVEELPCRQDRKEREDVLIFEALQLICAAAEQDQIGKRMIGHKRLEDDSRRPGIKRSRIPVNQPWDKRATRVREFFGERVGQLHRPPLMCGINSIPFPLLQFLRFLAFRLYSSFSGPPLVLCAVQRNPDGDKGNDGGCPPSESRERGPVEVARQALFSTRSQVLEISQRQFPLWSGRHSATGMIRGMFCHE